jgi:thioester reductase-like protein
LTGVTDFLGAFLLADLLKSTSAKIVYLVRFNDPLEDNRPVGFARLRRNLLDLGLWHDSILHRIEVVPGTLSHKKLGFSPSAFEELAARVQVIVRASATVNGLTLRSTTKCQCWWNKGSFESRWPEWGYRSIYLY